LVKKIKIEKPHFIFHYILPGKEPWATQDGMEQKGRIQSSEDFTTLIQREGSQAKATAINIGKKYAVQLAKEVIQGELIPKA